MSKDTKRTTPPPPMAQTADELLKYADQLRATAAGILTRAGELVEVAEEMRRAAR